MQSLAGGRPGLAGRRRPLVHPLLLLGVGGVCVSQAYDGIRSSVGGGGDGGPIRPGIATVALGRGPRLLWRLLQGAHAHAAHLL